MVDEQQLLERLLADDAQAYQELVNTYQSSMYAVAVAIAGFKILMMLFKTLGSRLFVI